MAVAHFAGDHITGGLAKREAKRSRLNWLSRRVGRNGRINMASDILIRGDVAKKGQHPFRSQDVHAAQRQLASLRIDANRQLGKFSTHGGCL